MAPDGNNGIEALDAALRDLERAVADVRRGAARPRAVRPKGTLSERHVDEAGARLDALATAMAGLREAAGHAEAAGKVALGEEGRQLVRLRRALAAAEIEAAAADVTPPFATQRARAPRRLTFAPGIAAVGAAATVIASVALASGLLPDATSPSGAIGDDMANAAPLVVGSGGTVSMQDAAARTGGTPVARHDGGHDGKHGDANRNGGHGATRGHGADARAAAAGVAGSALVAWHPRVQAPQGSANPSHVPARPVVARPVPAPAPSTPPPSQPHTPAAIKPSKSPKPPAPQPPPVSKPAPLPAVAASVGDSQNRGHGHASGRDKSKGSSKSDEHGSDGHANGHAYGHDDGHGKGHGGHGH